MPPPNLIMVAVIPLDFLVAMPPPLLPPTSDAVRALVPGGVFILFMTGVAFVTGALSNVYFWNEKGKIALAMVTDAVTSISPGEIGVVGAASAKAASLLADTKL